MMQPAESVVRLDATRGSGTSSRVRRSLPESKMRAVLVVVADILGEKSLQMAFVHCDDVIQQFATATAYPSLCNSILPRTPQRSADTFDFHRSDCDGHLRPILGVMIEDVELEADPNGNASRNC